MLNVDLCAVSFESFIDVLKGRRLSMSGTVKIDSFNILDNVSLPYKCVVFQWRPLPFKSLNVPYLLLNFEI